MIKISILFMELFQAKKVEMEKAIKEEEINEPTITNEYDQRNAA